MQQILVIHGGSSFNSYEAYLANLQQKTIDYEQLKKTDKWREWLPGALLQADVLLPNFPNGQNAKYDEWRIVFEKIIPYLTGEVSLVGYSLGAMFLAKYLHEHTLQHKAKQLILVAPGYDDESTEDLGSFRVASATGLEASAHTIHLFHSQDDPIVPFTEMTKFQRDLPMAIPHIFTDRNHFFQPTFPELAELLQQK